MPDGPRTKAHSKDSIINAATYKIAVQKLGLLWHIQLQLQTPRQMSGAIVLFLFRQSVKIFPKTAWS